MPGGVARPAGLEQEPGAPLDLVDPDFDVAGGGDVTMLVADVVHFTQPGGHRLVVFAQFAQHVRRLDIVGIVVEDTLGPRDVADRTQRGTTELANALGDRRSAIGSVIA